MPLARKPSAPSSDWFPRRRAAKITLMDESQIETEHLLAVWQDAMVAAELADRLATEAADALSKAEASVESSRLVSVLAKRAAEASAGAAETAREAAHGGEELPS